MRDEEERRARRALPLIEAYACATPWLLPAPGSPPGRWPPLSAGHLAPAKEFGEHIITFLVKYHTTAVFFIPMLQVPERNGAPSALGVLLSGVPVQSVPWILGTCTCTIYDPKGCLRQPSLLPPVIHVGLYLLLSPATTLFLVPLW